jgi:hypothetical protein
MNLTRRAFFKGLASIAAVAVTPIDFVSARLGVPTEFAPAIRKSYADIVAETLMAHREQMIENVTRHNPLLERLTRQGKV